MAGVIGWKAAAAADAIDPQAAGRDLVACLSDLPADQTAVLRQLLMHTRSAAELGYLRPQVYRLLSLHQFQDEAERRLVALDPRFDARLRRTRHGSELPNSSLPQRTPR